VMFSNPEVFFINPVVLDRGGTMGCNDIDDNGTVRTTTRSSSVTLMYRNKDFMKATTIFIKKDACMIQLLLDEMDS